MDLFGLITYSRGQILFYSDEHDDDPYCYVEIIHNEDVVSFELVVGRDI